MNVEGIILAAGLSTRCKNNKLKLEIGGKKIIERCIESMYDYVSEIYVVCGYDYESIKKIVNKYYKVETIYNKDYMKGMNESVNTGIEKIKAERFFLIPGDYPLVDKETYKKMLLIDDDIVIPTYMNVKGYPILIKKHVIKSILNENILDNIIDKNKTLIGVNDQGIIVDIDTMDDYYNIYRQFHK